MPGTMINALYALSNLTSWPSYKADTIMISLLGRNQRSASLMCWKLHSTSERQKQNWIQVHFSPRLSI